MANLRMLDMQVIDDLFQRPNDPGYVLDFSGGLAKVDSGLDYAANFSSPAGVA